MRAVIYTRVSSDPTGHARSVGEQEADCRAVCDREGWDVAEVVSDNDRGASRWSKGGRNGYERLSELLRTGDVLVTWESSRAQRDLEAYVSLRNLCSERGVLWCYSGRTYDLSLGSDRFATGMDALIAEKSSEETRERVLRALQVNANTGRPHGRLPYGYRFKHADSGARAVIGREPVPEEAAVIRELAERVLNREPIRAILRDLTSRGIVARNGKPFSRSSIDRILHNPVYAAKRIHHGRIVADGNWDPIITEAEHHALLALLADPTRLTHRGVEARWLLTGIARCGVCGDTCSRIKRMSGSRSMVYRCRSKLCVVRAAVPVDEMVEEFLLYWVTQPGVVEALTLVPEPDATAAEAEADELQARLDGFLDAAAAGGITPEALARIEATLLPKIQKARTRALPQVVEHPLAEFQGDNLAMATARWQGFPMYRRRDIVRSVFDVVILPTERGRNSFDRRSVQINWR